MTGHGFFLSGFAKPSVAEIGPGTRLHNGRYALENLIGTGAHGRVFSAQDQLLKRDVALKVAGGSGCDPGQAGALLLREAYAYHTIGGHANILQMYDLFEEGDLVECPLVLVVERACYGTLRDWIVRYRYDHETRLRQGKALFRQICQGFSHMHKHGVVHGDSKPENFVFTLPDCVKLADFGLARFTLPLRSRLPFLSLPFDAGTPEYMDPDLLSGHCRDADPGSDIFSLGCLAFELFDPDCRRPFEERRDELKRNCLNRIAPPLKGVPEKYARMVAKCLERT